MFTLLNQTRISILSIPFFFLLLRTCSSVDTVYVFQNITDGETIVSENDRFELGFFSPGSSRNRYLGIWFKHTSPHTVVWVANRETPLNNTLGMVRLDSHGILSLFNGGGMVIWSSNSSASGINIVNNPVAQLLDTGNLVIKDGNIVSREDFLWQSFDYPGDTYISGMKLGKNLVTGRETYLTSWRSADDPSPGLSRRLSGTSSLGSMEESFYLQASLDSSDTFSERRNPGESTTNSYYLKSMTPNAFEAALRQKEGELASYMSRLASMESIRDSLAEELVKMTEECEKLRSEVSQLPGLKSDLEALRRRHSAALELMGERDEELEELRADIVDLKEMYREQVNMLVNKIQVLSSSVSASA